MFRRPTRCDARIFPALQPYVARHLAFLLLIPLVLWAGPHDNDYRIDSSCSEAMFRVRLFWLDKVNGAFTHVDGDVVSGPRPDSWVVNATIPVDSVTLPSTRMRQLLLAPSFFDVEHHPTIHFVSDPIAQQDLEHGGTLTGYITLRGVTAPIHFNMQPAQCEQSEATPCRRIVLRGMLQRSTFGMTSDRLALSDNVDLNLNITLQPYPADR
jgi:polyisoprenoid-binding protein YceI